MAGIIKSKQNDIIIEVNDKKNLVVFHSTIFSYNGTVKIEVTTSK